MSGQVVCLFITYLSILASAWVDKFGPPTSATALHFVGFCGCSLSADMTSLVDTLVFGYRLFFLKFFFGLAAVLKKSSGLFYNPLIPFLLCSLLSTFLHVLFLSPFPFKYSFLLPSLPNNNACIWTSFVVNEKKQGLTACDSSHLPLAVSIRMRLVVP